MMYSGLIYICVCVCVRVCIYSRVCAFFNEYISQKITIILIIKLMEFSLKIEMSHFIVGDIIAMRQVVTNLM